MISYSIDGANDSNIGDRKVYPGICPFIFLRMKSRRAQKVGGNYALWKGSLNSMLTGRLEFKPARKAV